MLAVFIGDSLTAGNLGTGYLGSIHAPRGMDIRNCGRDGDTVTGVRERLKTVLERYNPSLLVIQIGANDVLIPEMAARGGYWTPFVERMENQGSRPVDTPVRFGRIYQEVLTIAQAWGVGSILGVTIPPLGEQLSSDRNRCRNVINVEIRNVLSFMNAGIADVAAVFEAEIKKYAPISDYFFSMPQEFAADVRTVRQAGSTMGLSEERGLFLTMDGAHLNERGAALMARTIQEALEGVLGPQS